MAFDRVSNFPHAEPHECATRGIAADVLGRPITIVPHKIRIILTDNGPHFTTPGHPGSAVADIRPAIERGELSWAHAFEAHAFQLSCARSDIEHWLAKPNHPWTSGQVKRMNRTIKEANVRRNHYDSHEQLRDRLTTFLEAYNFAKRLKSPNELTPSECTCKVCAQQPQRLRLNPIHHTAGSNI